MQCDDNSLSRPAPCRELWLIFIVKALESYSYFSMSIIYVIFLTDTFRVGDVAAGGSYGIWGMLTVAWGVMLGPAIDHFGATSALCTIPPHMAQARCQLPPL